MAYKIGTIMVALCEINEQFAKEHKDASDPVVSRGMCHSTSSQYIGALQVAGILGELRHAEDHSHTWVYIKELHLMVDWTSRQFRRDDPWPFLRLEREPSGTP